MLKRIWKSFVGCVRWVFWVLTFAILANAAFIFALIITPAMFYLFWRARSFTDVVGDVGVKVTERLVEELQKFEWKDVEFEADFGDDDDDDM